MTPVEQAAQVYRQEECARTFREDLEAHLLHGMVFSSPTAFIMVRYVRRDWGPARIVNPWDNDPDAAHDCLHVYLAAGDLKEFFTFPHQYVRWISFERTNILRFYRYNHLRRLCMRSLNPPSMPTSTPS